MARRERFRRAAADDLPVADINTTPLIDVMLVLLVMIIITIPIQLHSVNLNMPTGNPPPMIFPRHVKSGEISNRSCAPPRARRKPVITSSKINSAPFAFVIWRRNSK